MAYLSLTSFQKIPKLLEDPLLQRTSKSSFITKKIIIDISFSHLYVKSSSCMTLCLKQIDDVSMVTTIVVVVTTNYIGVVTIGHVVDELDPS
jgi:hypothetical protein